MAFLDKTGLQTLTNKLVQGDAIKVASHRGHTVKNVIDNLERECNSVATPNTMELENRISSFKIGQGRDFDAKDDVETGYMEMEFKGKTWHNLVNHVGNRNTYRLGLGLGQNPSNSIIKTYEGNDYASRTFDSLEHNFSYFYLLINEGGIARKIKPKTKYTLFVDITSNRQFRTNYLSITQGDARESLHASGSTNAAISVGKYRYKFTVTTRDSFEGIIVGNQGFYISLTNDKNICSGMEIRIENAIILEGDHTQTPIHELPNYFEGIKSSFEDGIVDIDIFGKNLLDLTTYVPQLGSYSSGLPHVVSYSTVDSTLEVSSEGIRNKVSLINNYNRGCCYKLNLKKNHRYSIQCVSSSGAQYCVKIYGYNSYEFPPTQNNYRDFNMQPVFNAEGTTPNTKTSFNSKDFNTYILYVGGAWRSDMSKEYNVDISKIQIEEVVIPSSYEPFHKKKISFNIEEPLRSVPNGVSDEIRNNNGQWELVRRVGKIVLNGSEYWSKWEADWVLPNSTVFTTPKFPNSTSPRWGFYYGSESISDKIPSYADNAMRITDALGYTNDNTAGSKRFRIPNNMLTTLDANGFKQWLQANPTTVLYELSEPVITPIEPVKFETQPLGSITINSEIAPTSFQKIELNRAAQIERGIVEINELKNRVDVLEEMYNTQFLEVQHKLALLGLDYELEQYGGTK